MLPPMICEVESRSEGQETTECRHFCREASRASQPVKKLGNQNLRACVHKQARSFQVEFCAAQFKKEFANEERQESRVRAIIERSRWITLKMTSIVPIGELKRTIRKEHELEGLSGPLNCKTVQALANIGRIRCGEPKSKKVSLFHCISSEDMIDGSKV